MKIDYQDRIDDYLLDRMTPGQRSAFERELASNSELREQLEFTQDMQHALKSRNEKLEAMKEWEGQGAHTHKSVVYWVSSIAAVLVIGLFLFPGIIRMQRSPDLSEWVRFQEGVRSSGTSYATIDSLLLQENYKDALVLIEKEISELKADSCRIANDTTINEEALEYNMLRVDESNDDLKWMEAIALLGLDRKDEALTILDELRNKEGIYQEQAKSLYKLVKKK